MSVSINCIPSRTRYRMTLELHCTKCDCYFGWYPDDEAGYDAAKEHQSKHESSCTGNERLTSDALAAKMKAHIKERKAIYDALTDNPDRVIANSGTESLQTADQDKIHDWSTFIRLRGSMELPGRMAEALIALDECNYDHDCGGEGDYPRCKECRAVRLLRTMILELGAHGIGR